MGPLVDHQGHAAPTTARPLQSQPLQPCLTLCARTEGEARLLMWELMRDRSRLGDWYSVMLSPTRAENSACRLPMPCTQGGCSASTASLGQLDQHLAGSTACVQHQASRWGAVTGDLMWRGTNCRICCTCTTGPAKTAGGPERPGMIQKPCMPAQLHRGAPYSIADGP